MSLQSKETDSNCVADLPCLSVHDAFHGHKALLPSWAPSSIKKYIFNDHVGINMNMVILYMKILSWAEKFIFSSEFKRN